MMAQVATTDQKATMRTKGQWSELFAAIFFPHTIYTARLLAVPTTTDMIAEITFDSGAGTLANVKPDMTLWVGTSVGAYDLGMARIRKDPISGTFYIGEQSRINWEASCYLTVVDDFDLKAKHIHIVDGLGVMDYDVEYSDQHTVFKPVPVLGPHRVKKLTGADVDVQLGPEAGYASWVFDSTITTYLWVCPTGTFNNSAIASPVATFDTAGWHLCYCTVTAANGQTKTGVRYVYIYDDDNPPFRVTEAPDYDEDIDSAGCNFSITLANNALLSQIHERAFCILFSVDHYDSVLDAEIDSVGPIVDAENIEGVGRIIAESITYDPEKSFVTFEVQGYQEWFGLIRGFPSGLEMATNTPAAWTEMPELTVDRALWHFLEWRCTATVIMDIKLTDDDRYALELSSLSDNLWSQMQEFSFLTIFAYLSVDSYGRFFAEIEPQLVPLADRDWPTVMALTKADFFDEAELERIITPDTSSVDFSGVAVDISGRASSFFSLSPGRVPADYGSLKVEDRYLVVDQAGSNQTAGLLFGWAVSKYKTLTKNLLNNKMISCFPRQFVEYSLAAGDTLRGDVFTVNLLPRRRRMNFNPETGFKYYELEFEAETFEQITVNGDIPGSGDASIPPSPPFPSLPAFPILFPSDVSASPDGPAVVLLVDDTKGILYSTNFNVTGADVKWQFWNAGIDPADVPHIVTNNPGVAFFRTPSGAYYVGIGEKNFFGRGMDTIYYAPALGGMFTKIIDPAYLNGLLGTNGMVNAIGYNPNKPEEVALWVVGPTAGGFMLGDHAGFVMKNTYNSPSNFKGNLTFGGGKWIIDEIFAAAEHWTRYSADGLTREAATASFGQGQAFWHARAGTSAVIVKPKPIVTGIGTVLRSIDNAANVTNVDTSPEQMGRNMAISPDGLQILANWDAATGIRGKSSDGGTSWSGLPTLPLGGEYAFAYAGGLGAASRWIAARGVVRYSDDFGDTWQNREGNLSYLIPISMSINKILVPGFTS